MRILREPEVCLKLGLGKTQVRELFTRTGKLRWIALGPRSKGALESEVDALISELAKNRTPLPRPPMICKGKPKQKTRKAA